ncbi:MAG TPA: hypothetical protein PLS49_03060 [Candidatus Woesebacteria bacterium]|nr:hypothetical protein [Candidatus Woesebacteria bacterium]
MSKEQGHGQAILNNINKTAQEWLRPVGPQTSFEREDLELAVRAYEGMIKSEVKKGTLPPETSADLSDYLTEDIYDEDPNERVNGWRE